MTKTQYVEWDLNNRGKSKPDSIADSDASAASSGGKCTVNRIGDSDMKTVFNAWV